MKPTKEEKETNKQTKEEKRKKDGLDVVSTKDVFVYVVKNS
jgi:hypothetical protein